MMLGGVFERFPRLKFVMTEMGAAWIPPLLKQLDAIIANVRKGEIGELKYTDENALARSATEYFNQNCWVAASQPGPADARPHARSWRPTGSCGGATTRTTRARGRSRPSTCARCSTTSTPTSSSASWASNAAKLYDFDLDALAPLAERVRADRRRDRAAAARAPGEPQQRAAQGSGSADRLNLRAAEVEPVASPMEVSWKSPCTSVRASSLHYLAVDDGDAGAGRSRCSAVR